MISYCSVCHKYRSFNLREPLLSHEIPKSVWNKVAINLSLVVIDHTSKYFEQTQQPNASSDTIITHMRSIFARHSILLKVVTICIR